MVQVKGGGPYGARIFAGDGPRQPTELELGRAFHQGKYIAALQRISSELLDFYTLIQLLF
ncbi:hypothetical protein MKW98_019183 [Papaver atlanticum]|uniref:Uncharacterized protein n=1 Tax=Papaver atlanticum TaxID=357466 RepID=A0AAD4XV19_9MAGN|nr:hypothetical protein MKW98_019183 [Papaver atlanticum]